MIKKVIMILLAVMLVFGTTSAKAEAKQLPEILQRANTLVYKMVKLGEAGVPVPQELAYKYAEKMYKAYGLAEEMVGTAQEEAMAQIRTALQTQTQTMKQYRKNFPATNDPLMAQVMTMLQAQNRMSELETFEPLKFQAVVKTMLKAGALTGGGTGQSSGLHTGTGSANGGNGNNGGGGGNGGK